MSKMNSSLGIARILSLLSQKEGSVHFSGVGGVGMCSLFCLAHDFGISVSGSDRESTEVMSYLISLGADVVIGERERLPDTTKLLVYTLALSEQDRELVEAEKCGIPTVSRAEFLGALMECYRERIGVSGSHGKSTVTAMLYSVFSTANLSPTVLSGASLPQTRLPFSFGTLDYLIYEACEYKDSFLCFSPTVSVFLNLELDHVDYFSSIEQLEASFLKAMNKSPAVLVNYDDERLCRLSRMSNTRVYAFSRGKETEFGYVPISTEPHNMSFDMYNNGNLLGRIDLPMIGDFNIQNAAAAVSVGLIYGISFDVIKRALSAFVGIERRLENIGEYKNRSVYYDYAHHPTEIRESIRAVRADSASPVSVVFGAHTYSRTKGLFRGFVEALSLADYVILTDIYAAREEDEGGVSIEKLAAEIGAEVCPRASEIREKIDKTDGSIIIMGAADLRKIKNELIIKKY